MSLKTKELSIGRFDQLFVFVHRLSVAEVISVIGIINFCLVLAWSFCLQKHMFLKTKRPSIGWYDYLFLSVYQSSAYVTGIVKFFFCIVLGQFVFETYELSIDRFD